VSGDTAALDAAVLRHREDPTDASREALLAEQRRFTQAFYERQAACWLGQVRGEHARGGCPECG
jgi:hypothetical protein